MTPTATGIRPGYHATLSDGTTTVGFIAAQGAPAIRRLARGRGVQRNTAKQTTWIGGRGNRRFVQDTTRFFDSGHMATYVPDQLVSGPLACYARGFRTNLVQLQPSSGHTVTPIELWYPGVPFTNRPVMATSFVAPASFSAVRVGVWVRKVGTVTETLTVSLYSDTAGLPNAKLLNADADLSPANVEAGLWVYVPLTLNASTALTVSTTYHVVVDTTQEASPDGNHWEVLGLSATTGYSGSALNDLPAWGAVSHIFAFRVEASDHATAGQGKFFEYLRQMYMLTAPDAGGAPQLYMNGDRGIATGAQTSSTLKDTTKSWVTNEWAGNVVLIAFNAGKGQWRRIVSNTSDTLTISPTWAVTPVTGLSGTCYVILGSDKWTEITGHGLTAPVTDVCPVNLYVYFAQGDAVAMRRMREYSAGAGVWTREFDAEAQEATFLGVAMDDAGTGAVKVYRAVNDTVKWDKASAVTTWVDLTWAGEQPIGDSQGLATSIVIYNNDPWIGKEDDLGPIKNGQWKSANVPIRWGRDEENCRNMKPWNTQLFFPFMGGFERLYGQQIDDIGPNRDEGLPADRRGRVADFIPVLKFGYAAIDADTDGYSSIMMTTAPGGDWHEIYRAPEAGHRIRNLYYQTIPGGPNRLWFKEGNDIGWVYRERDTGNPQNDDNMVYRWESHLITSWFDFDSPDLDHFFSELRFFSRAMSESSFYGLNVEYQVDDEDGAWTPYVTTLQDFLLSHRGTAASPPEVTGGQLRFRLIFNINDLADPLTLLAYEVRGNTIHEVLYDYHIDVRLEDRLDLLNGNTTSQKATEVIAQLATWQEDATPLTWRCVVSAFDNKQVHLNPTALVPESWDTKETKIKGGLWVLET